MNPGQFACFHHTNLEAYNSLREIHIRCGRVPRNNAKYLPKRLTYIYLLFLFIWFGRYWRWRRHFHIRSL